MSKNQLEQLVELRSVDFSHDGNPVLENVDFTVDAGEFACVVGPNGGGKTTLLKIVLGLLEPSRGEVLLFGAPPGKTRRKAGYVPQEIRYDRKFPIRVEDIVRTGTLNSDRLEKSSRAEKRRMVDEALERMNLGHLRGRKLDELSGGQRRRVLIARALATGTDLLLMDEPTTNVDVEVENIIIGLFEELAGKKSFLVVTHNINLLSKFHDKVLCMNRSLHRHPPTEKVDAELMQHMCGYNMRTSETTDPAQRFHN